MEKNETRQPLTGPLRAAAAVAAVALVGCASAPPQEAPKIERLTGAALEARTPAPVAAVALSEIAAMAKHGAGAEDIVAKLDASRSHYRLDAGQIADLLAQGVPSTVIDHILETERRRIFDDMATEIAQRERACLDQVEREVRQCRLQSLMQPWPGGATCWPPHTGFPYWRCF